MGRFWLRADLCPGAVLLLFLFFSIFFSDFYLKPFAKLLQIDSNQF
jgi:hypothetical protein